MKQSEPTGEPAPPEIPPAPRKVNRETVKTVLTTSIILLLLIVSYVLFRPPQLQSQTAEEQKDIVVSVRAAKVEKQPIAMQTAALGTITPREQATVSPKISSQIKKMRLLRNTAVRAGETIAVLEAGDLQTQRAEAAAALQQAQLNAKGIKTGSIPQATAQAEKDLRDARANVNNARLLYERRRELYNQGGIALKEVEAAQLALTTAENSLKLAEQSATLRAKTLSPNEQAVADAQVKAAQDRLANFDAQIGYANIRAPFSGIITEQFQFEGEFATAGAKLFTIADLSEVIIKVPFADSIVAQLKIGDEADVLPTDLPGENLSGRISLISQTTDPQNRTVEVWVNLKNTGGRLRANGAAQVIVHANAESEALVAPAPAVTLETSDSNTGTVMVIDNESVAHEKKVTVGIKTHDFIEILSGLKEGDTVVIEGNYALPDGTKVEVAPEEEKDDKGDSKSGGEEGEKP
jgi:HlyD family secretion protein